MRCDATQWHRKSGLAIHVLVGRQPSSSPHEYGNNQLNSAVATNIDIPPFPNRSDSSLSGYLKTGSSLQSRDLQCAAGHQDLEEDG